LLCSCDFSSTSHDDTGREVGEANRGVEWCSTTGHRVAGAVHATRGHPRGYRCGQWSHAPAAPRSRRTRSAAALVVERTIRTNRGCPVPHAQSAVGERSNCTAKVALLIPASSAIGRVESLRLDTCAARPPRYIASNRQSDGIHAARPRGDRDQRLPLVVFTGEQCLHFHRLRCRRASLNSASASASASAALAPASSPPSSLSYRQIVESLPQLHDAAPTRPGCGKLAGHPLRPSLVIPQIGIGGTCSSFSMRLRRPSTVEHPLHRGQGGVEAAMSACTVGVHS